MSRWRRIYRKTGKRCDDCGWEKPVTKVSFWVNGFVQFYCKDCIKPYRKVLNTHYPVEWGRLVA